MSQKIYTNLDIKGNATIGDITNATSDTDKFLVSDAGVVKYRTGSEMLSDLGVVPGVASNVQHQVKAGVAINKGQAVYVTSADGTNMIVGLASNTAEVTSSKTMGLLDNTVAINGFANVVTEGLLAGLNTIGANAGDPVWLGTNGNLIYGIANKPYAPAHLVFIGIVTRVNANNGEIFVKVQNGFELDELHDVDLKSSTPVGNQILAFEGAPVNLWKNKTISSVLGYTPYNASNPAGYISSYSETDTLASVTGRGNVATTSIAGRNSFLVNKSDGSAGGQLSFDSSINQLYLWNSVSSGYFSVYTNNNERLKITSAGSVISTVEHQSPIYYDYNDTSYYVNPNADSRLSRTYIGNYTNWMTLGAWDGVNNRIEAIGQPLFLTSYGGSIKFGYQGSTQMELSTAGNVAIGGTPSSYKLDVNGNIRAYMSNLVLDHTGAVGGIQWGVNPYIQGVANGGFEIRDNTNSVSRFNITSGGNVTAEVDMRSPIFYDSNNTGYYGDFAGTSRINSVQADYVGVGQAINTSYRIIADGSMYLNSNGNGWAEGVWKQRRSGGTFYDVLDTGNISSYAVPLSRTITINGTSYDLSANRSWTVTANATETDTLATVTARGAMTTSDIHTPNNGGIFFNGNGVYGSGVFGRNAGQDLGFNAGGVETMRAYSDGYIQAVNSFRAPIFYDSNNTGYYGDFASTSRINTINIDTLRGPQGDWLLGYQSTSTYSLGSTVVVDTLNIDFSNVKFSPGSGNLGNNYFWLNKGGSNDGGLLWSRDNALDWQMINATGSGDLTFYAYGSGTNVLTLGRSGGAVTATGSMRSPIFYDSNDTGYYLDPASTSRLGKTNIYRSVSSNVSGPALRVGKGWDGGIADIGYDTVVIESNDVATIRVGESDGTQGGMCWGDSNTTFTSTHPFRFYTGGNAGGYIYDGMGGTLGLTITGGYAQSNSSLRAPIFYDSNDTGYYVDPNGSSQMSTINAVRFASVMGSQSPDNSHPGFGIRPFYSWNIGQANNSGAGYSNGITIGSNPGDQAYGFQIVQNMWDDQLYFRRYNSGWQGWRTALDNTNYSSYSNFGGNSVYGGIYYDANNTGYYCDPASGSNFSSVYADNWFRTYGQTGLYSQSYGIHFYPQTGSAWSITGSGGNIELQFRSNHNSTIRGYVYADTSNNIGFLTSGGGWRLRCDDSGNAIATGDVTAYSDRRVKENIHTIDNALDKVNNLRGVYYTRIDSEDKQRKVGVIAQETLEVLPEVVGQDTDGMYNVAYGNITAVLIEAIKEQQTQIEELKELVNQLIKK